MMGVPVVIAENGLGTPVRPVDSGAPVLTIAENGLGAPIVISDLGAPFVINGLDTPLEGVTHEGVLVTHNGEIVTYGGE